MARPIAYSAKSVVSEEVLKTSRAAHAARVNVSQEMHRVKMVAFVLEDLKDELL